MRLAPDDGHHDAQRISYGSLHERNTHATGTSISSQRKELRPIVSFRPPFSPAMDDATRQKDDIFGDVDDRPRDISRLYSGLIILPNIL